MAEEVKDDKAGKVEYFNDGLIDELPEEVTSEVKVEAKEEAAPVEKAKEEAPPKKEAKVEDKEDRVASLERELAETKAQLAKSSTKEVPPEKELKTIEDLFDDEFNTAPKDAVKSYLKREKLAEAMKQELAHTTNVVQLAAEGKVPGWEDFRELVPEIQALVEQYKDYVRPEFGGRVQLVELLAWAARGKRAAYQASEKAKQETKDAEEKAAKEKADKAKETVFMESGASGVSVNGKEISVEDFGKLSLSEMEKLLPYAE